MRKDRHAVWKCRRYFQFEQPREHTSETARIQDEPGLDLARFPILVANGQAWCDRIGFHPDHRLSEMKTGSRSEEHTSELQSLMRNSYAVFCLKKKKSTTDNIMNN